MERLTDVCWRNFDPWECCGQDYYCTRGCHDEGGCTKGCIVPRLYAHLAAYEDIGLGPEEIKERLEAYKELFFERADLYNEIGSIEHICDLIQAEKDGRLVVLPCKVGDTIYNIFYGKIIETKVRTFFFGHPSHRVEQRNLRMIRTDKWDIPMCNLGKTVFLTRTEAEAALKKREEEDNEVD